MRSEPITDGATPMSQALRAPALTSLLKLVPITPGSQPRILELDTDGQYGASAIDLTNQTGGSVISLSPSTRTVSRARAVHSADQRVAVPAPIMAAGWPAGGPYDLILAWPLTNAVPSAWVAQCAPGGHLLCPVFLHDPRGAFAVLRLSLDRPGHPGEAVAATVRPGSPSDAVQWAIRPAHLIPIDDGHLVRSPAPAAPEHRHAG